MINKAGFVAAILLGLASAGASAAGFEARATPQLLQKRQSLAGTSADAMAILNALQREPALARQLAANPAGAQALLRSRGATRAESIAVVPDELGAQRIRIIVKIDDVTTEIAIDL